MLYIYLISSFFSSIYNCSLHQIDEREISNTLCDCQVSKAMADRYGVVLKLLVQQQLIATDRLTSTNRCHGQ